jgi:hypothetical protein
MEPIFFPFICGKQKGYIMISFCLQTITFLHFLKKELFHVHAKVMQSYFKYFYSFVKKEVVTILLVVTSIYLEMSMDSENFENILNDS